MSNNHSSSQSNSPLTSQVSNEIDVKQIARTLLRKKNLIAKVTASTFLASLFYSLIVKPTWEGQFQIVLESQDSSASARLSQLAASNPLLSNLAGVGGGGDSQLQTEVKVLESPSVLKPTYDFVKASKAKAGENVSGWSFLDWRENSLEVKLEKGTSVLNISYRDTDPDIVLPVIEKISHDYQQYSGRDRQRGIRNGISYLEKQISEIRKQSFKSMRQAQSYGLANGLGLPDGLPGVSKAAGDISGSTSLESRRDTAQIRVNALEQQLKTARSTINRSVFQAAQLDANTQLFKELQGLETLLLEKQALLKPTDDLIRQITRRRQNLITYINQQTIGLLEGQLVTAKSRLASLSRPHEVILKHRELVRTAMLDEKVLVELEAQLQNLQLEQARQIDPGS